MKKAALVIVIVVAAAAFWFYLGGTFTSPLSPVSKEAALQQARDFKCKLPDGAYIIQVATWGRHKATGVTHRFGTPCFPPGWEHAGSGPQPD